MKACLKEEYGNVLSKKFLNLNVNGSIAPIVFFLKENMIDKDIFIKEIRISMTLSSAPLGFGDLENLGKGFVFKKIGNSEQIIFNIKTNDDINNLAPVIFNVNEKILTSNIVFFDGIKIGCPLKIFEKEDLIILVQDDLSNIVSFNVEIFYMHNKT